MRVRVAAERNPAGREGEGRREERRSSNLRENFGQIRIVATAPRLLALVRAGPEEPKIAYKLRTWRRFAIQSEMICKLFDLEDYAGTYRETRNAYLKAANQLKLATGPYKAARDAYVAATATYTKSLYE